MTQPISPIGQASVLGLWRDAMVTRAAPAQAKPVARSESPRAPTPVDPAQRAADLRGEAMRDRPAGPPPAFEINVLDQIRADLGRADDKSGGDLEPRRQGGISDAPLGPIADDPPVTLTSAHTGPAGGVPHQDQER